MYETRIAQLEKERDQLTHEIETLNKKLQMQQRQLENLQKQTAGVTLNYWLVEIQHHSPKGFPVAL